MYSFTLYCAKGGCAITSTTAAFYLLLEAAGRSKVLSIL